MRFLLVSCIAVLLLTGCSNLPASENAPISVATSFTDTVPSLTSSPSIHDPVPSPTNIQPPFNPETGSDEYCKPPYAVLQVEKDNSISKDEIVLELVKIWLRRYKQIEVPPACRIADYAIEKIYDDPGLYSLALEPRGDFMRVVAFSVKLIQIPSDWMSFQGQLDPDNWLHVSHVVAITKTTEGYRLEFAYP